MYECSIQAVFIQLTFTVEDFWKHEDALWEEMGGEG